MEAVVEAVAVGVEVAEEAVLGVTMMIHHSSSS